MDQQPGNLVTRVRFDTAQPEQAHDFLRRAYVEHSPQLSGDRERFRFSAGLSRMDGFGIDHLTHSMRMHAEFDACRRLYVIQVLSGRYQIGTQRAVAAPGPGELVVADPTQPVEVIWDDVRLGVVSLDIDVLRRVATEVAGVSPGQLSFGLSTPVSPAKARHWQATVRHITRDVLASPELAENQLIIGEARRLLTVATLTTFPNATHNTPEGPQPYHPPAAVRRAVEFIEANAGRHIELGDIAEVARVGPRSLQAAFRRHLETTPTAYLHDIRLSRAHDDLVKGDPTNGDSVAAIATRWGFTHHGRFANAYRQRYGRTPRETLHQ